MVAAAVVSADRQSGFTLVEMMVVIASVALGLAMTFSTLSRTRANLEVEDAAQMMRQRLIEARGLAAVAGARLGTPRFVDCTGGNQLTVTIDPVANTYTIPKAVDYDAGTDVMTARCQTFNITTETNGIGILEFPTAVTAVQFTANGRVLNPRSPMAADRLYFRVKHVDEPRTYGFRLFPSGVMCTSGRSDDFECDRDS